MKILQDFALRRLAVKFFDNGFSVKQILKKVNRSRAWFYKWHQRFIEGGYSALKDRSKTPLHRSSHYSQKDVAVVLRIRQRLENASVGLIHAKVIQQEIKAQKLITSMPSVSTINRWLASSGTLAIKEHICVRQLLSDSTN